jgi:hypothetical protein
MTAKKGMKHYLVRLKRESVRLYLEDGKSYQEITERPARGFAPGPFPEVLIPDASKSLFPWVMAPSPGSIGLATLGPRYRSLGAGCHEHGSSLRLP